MSKLKNNSAFTLIELMVALVIGGLLMAALVGLGGAVRRSFSGSQDITELQANLRFALLRITEDFNRTAMMYFARPDNPGGMPCHLLGSVPPASWSPTGSWAAIEYDNSSNPLLTLRGNFTSTRDYYFEFQGADTGRIMCLDKTYYTPASGSCCVSESGRFKNVCCSVGAFNRLFDTMDDCMYYVPFSDGGGFSSVFAPGQVIMIEAQAGMFTFHRIVSNDTGAFTFTFAPAADLASITQGEGRRVRPLQTIQYEVVEDPAGSGRYVLLRHAYNPSSDGSGGVSLSKTTVELAEMLLPPNSDPTRSGFALEVVYDQSPNRGLCAHPWKPQLSDFTPIDSVSADDLLFARAIRITLRGRSEREDPHFVSPDYGSDPTLYDFAYDLNPAAKGLAHVRTYKTTVFLSNLGLNLTM
ncbi:MAG: prepilin-type N-terminal cleavage/methylation domain-containing protein [Deltaproteobacteria bacterium]|nr:MAG: prepilin-type N-terminal cleavage/methylation domain-containing protein [Deltaproteobacteria bacterium]